MSKSPITWLELIKEKLNDAKKEGKSPSIREVVPEAKKEWVQIKNGTHPKYMQGKAKTHARKGKKSSKNAKTKKSSSSAKSSASAPSMNMNDILDKAKVCKKCRKNIEKAMKKSEMKGGSGCGCSGGMSGGCATCSPV
jgi:hypothetical protein